MNVSIKLGSYEEMLELWDGRYESFVDDYVRDIKLGNHEVLLMKDNETNRFIGEIHIVWDSGDKDQANGIDTAYILSLELLPEYQGKKLSRLLIKQALIRIKEKGFHKATIGADDIEREKLNTIYQKWRFTKEIKRSSFEYEEQGQTVLCTYSLLLNDKL
ncbi:GNAT family N-acetyltransferase [Paludicola sp. MB14-C6]|uniref:GNAT family N-acetyltransferase n=1 Tax=Paludihabitans sp. MB14-C6 TaxID=3070656 RepID=UPI0027DE63A1|nr:GNAT family N-acetyltransferase [Paludicola sp. MB14-C6]WMJ22301.1 GNAT family N-acetyltransferase [Paludicola sp. MB14-C6]